MGGLVKQIPIKPRDLPPNLDWRAVPTKTPDDLTCSNLSYAKLTGAINYRTDLLLHCGLKMWHSEFLILMLT